MINCKINFEKGKITLISFIEVKRFIFKRNIARDKNFIIKLTKIKQFYERELFLFYENVPFLLCFCMQWWSFRSYYAILYKQHYKERYWPCVFTR